MVDEEKDIKIIPRAKKPFEDPIECSSSWSIKFLLFAAVFGSFLAMLTLVTFLPLDSTLKFLGILIGSFLLVDLHKTLKAKSYGQRLL